MIKIKKIFFLFLLTLYLLTSNTLAITNSIIGTIGNKPFTQHDLINEMKIVLILKGKFFSEENKREIQSIALRDIVNRLIKEIEIEKHNFNDFYAPDVDLEIKRIAKNLNMNIDDLKSAFKSNKVNFSLLEDRIKTELKWNGLIFQIYKNRINVNINEINDRLKLIQEKSFIDEYLIYEILVESVNKDKLDEEIKKIMNEINTNGFEKTAIRYSKSESSSKGGRLGWLKETMISKEFRKVLKNTNVGSTSKPILTSQGILFLKLEDKRILESAIDLEKEKNKLLKSEKDKKLHMYALSHFNKIKQSIAINYNIQ